MMYYFLAKISSLRDCTKKLFIIYLLKTYSNLLRKPRRYKNKHNSRPSTFLLGSNN